jgi:hypothetical protein
MLKLRFNQVFFLATFLAPFVAVAEIDFKAAAQVSVAIPTKTCQQLAPKNYVVLLNRPGNLLPQLPEFLAISAIPCGYMSNSITFFGNFNSVSTAAYRAEQLRQMGLDAIVHSFEVDTAQIPANLRGASVVVEPVNNLTLQQVQATINPHAQLVNFANRQVILALPLASFQVANPIAANMRSRGFAAQSIGANLVALSPLSPSPAGSVKPPEAGTNGTSKRTFRVLVPQENETTLGLVRAIAADAFPLAYQGRRYIQARTYNDVGNATRERDRLSLRFPGTIIVSE